MAFKADSAGDGKAPLIEDRELGLRLLVDTDDEPKRPLPPDYLQRITGALDQAFGR